MAAPIDVNIISEQIALLDHLQKIDASLGPLTDIDQNIRELVKSLTGRTADQPPEGPVKTAGSVQAQGDALVANMVARQSGANLTAMQFSDMPTRQIANDWPVVNAAAQTGTNPGADNAKPTSTGDQAAPDPGAGRGASDTAQGANNGPSNLRKMLGTTGRIGGGIAGGIAAGLPMAYGVGRSLYNMNMQQNQVRSMGYGIGGGAASQNQTAGQAFVNTAFGNPIAQALGASNAYNAFANSSLTQDFFSSLGLKAPPKIGAAQMLGGQAYATALQDSLKSGGFWSLPVAYSAIQESVQRGYTGPQKNSLFNQFYGAEKKTTLGTYGLIDPSAYAPLLDEMFRKFGQSFDKTATTIIGFNTAAQAAQKGLQDYTLEVTAAIQGIQQAGGTNATAATTAAQSYSSIPQLSGGRVQQIVSAATPFMMAFRTMPLNQNNLVSIMTGNTAAMAGEDPNQPPLQAAQAINDLVKKLQGQRGINRQAAIQEASLMTGISAGDLTALISPQNMGRLQKQVNLGVVEDQLSQKWSTQHGAAAASAFRGLLGKYNAAYGITSKTSLSQEQGILHKLMTGKDDFNQAMASLRAVGASGAVSQTTPDLGTITITAGSGTTISKTRAGSSNNKITTTRNSATATVPSGK